jgi:hypothetical protein
LRTTPTAVFIAAWLALNGAAAAAAERQLGFVVSYQGLFTAGMEVDIGRVALQLEAADEQRRDVLMLASTRGFEAAELILPVRFCYRSRQPPDDGGILQADWWSRVGGKAARGRLLVDHPRRRILRLHSERRMQQKATRDDDWLPPRTNRASLDQDRDEAPYPDFGAPLDRLGMIRRLRELPLSIGQRMRLPVTNGRHLLGYDIEVVTKETLQWNGGTVPVLHLRLQPLEQGKSGDRPVDLWLSDDARRLPLRFRSDHPHGSFEMRLAPDGVDTGVSCPVPEAVNLELPEA